MSALEDEDPLLRSLVSALSSARSASVSLTQTLADALRPRSTLGRLQFDATVQRTAGWLATRERWGLVTASKFGVVVGVSKYADAWALWGVMTGRVRADGANDDEHVRRGEAFEPVAIAAYERAMGVRVESTGLWLHAVHDWLGASPDGLLVGMDGLVEVKCPARGPAEEVSREHMAQVQGQLEICDRSFCDYVSFQSETGGMSVFRIRRSKAYWAWMFSRLAAFHECLLKDVAPMRRSDPGYDQTPPPEVDVRVVYSSS